MTPTFKNEAEEIAYLRAENAKLKAAKNTPVTMKVSEKGGVSVYGLGRFPVSLYKSQWEKLIKAIPTIEQFLIDNDSLLSTKDDPKETSKEASPSETVVVPNEEPKAPEAPATMAPRLAPAAHNRHSARQ